MKQLTFTVVLHVSDDDFAAYPTPEKLANDFTTYGDKHREWYADAVQAVTVEDESNED